MNVIRARVMTARPLSWARDRGILQPRKSLEQSAKVVVVCEPFTDSALRIYKLNNFGKSPHEIALMEYIGSIAGKPPFPYHSTAVEFLRKTRVTHDRGLTPLYRSINGRLHVLT